MSPSAALSPAVSPSAPVWCPDRGDGTYQNPILYADYSDPDAIRVGDDYWLTSSSFSHVPGLPILHSRDLVNWSLVNHALPQLVPAEHFSRPRHGAGVWAPAIRHHAGKFWIFYPDPDFGLYVVTADDPRGAWSAPTLVKAGRGLIDPCPFWDDDGSVWMIHGWAKSRSGINNRITLHRLSADAMSVADAGETIVDGASIPGWHTIEGPKLYKRAEYYYIFAPAGGVRDGYQAVFRSRSLHGPFEPRIVLAQGRTPVNGPHQGAWVDTPAGEHWFLHFQELPAYGRVVHLQPMRWENGWPVMGEGQHGDTPGQPVLVHARPKVGLALRAGLGSGEIFGSNGECGSNSGRLGEPAPPQVLAVPVTSDEFDTTAALSRQWQWQANPQRDWWSLSRALSITCVPMPPGATLWSAAHLLMQKFPAPEFEVTTRLRLTAHADGDRAGLVVFGHDYAWIGLRREAGKTRLVFARCESAHKEGTETELNAIECAGDAVQLRVSVSAGGLCRFAYSVDGAHFRAFGPEFQAKSSYWVGAKVGLFASAAGASSGRAEVSWFRVTALSS